MVLRHLSFCLFSLFLTLLNLCVTASIVPPKQNKKKGSPYLLRLVMLLFCSIVTGDGYQARRVPFGHDSAGQKPTMMCDLALHLGKKPNPYAGASSMAGDIRFGICCIGVPRFSI
jgi:hypothetical protein